MPKAIFIDFYGTVVHEDGAVIKKITDEIYTTGTAQNRSEIGTFWWNEFQSLFQSAYGDRFQTQRELEYQSLLHTMSDLGNSRALIFLTLFISKILFSPLIFCNIYLFCVP